jgi:hypothetical protein
VEYQHLQSSEGVKLTLPETILTIHVSKKGSLYRFAISESDEVAEGKASTSITFMSREAAANKLDYSGHQKPMWWP